MLVTDRGIGTAKDQVRGHRYSWAAQEFSTVVGVSFLLAIEAAERDLGVDPNTLGRWEKVGCADQAEHAHLGRKCHDLSKLRHRALCQALSVNMTIVRPQVAANGQQGDVACHQALLEFFWEANGWIGRRTSDLGSGLDYYKRRLRQSIPGFSWRLLSDKKRRA